MIRDRFFRRADTVPIPTVSWQAFFPGRRMARERYDGGDQGWVAGVGGLPGRGAGAVGDVPAGGRPVVAVGDGRVEDGDVQVADGYGDGPGVRGVAGDAPGTAGPGVAAPAGVAGVGMGVGVGVGVGSGAGLERVGQANSFPL